MKTRLGCLLLLLLPLCLFAQPDTLWTRALPAGFSACYSADSTFDGGIILAGKSTEVGFPSGYFVCKVDQDFDTVWTRCGVVNNETVCFAVQQTFDHGIMLAGRARSDQTNRSYSTYWLMKTDAQGDSLWGRLYSLADSAESRCYAAIQTADSGFALAGAVGTHRAAYDEASYIGLLKTNAQGDSLWSRLYRTPDFRAECRMIHQMDDGGFLLGFSCTTWGFGLLRTDATGDSLWSRWYFEDASVIYSVTPTSDGGYFFTGRKGWWDDSGLKWMKSDADFMRLWSGDYAPNGDGGEAHAALEMPDGGFVLTGFIRAYGGCTLLRVTSQGAVAWSRIYPSRSSSECWTLMPQRSGGFLVSGFNGMSSELIAFSADSHIPLVAHPSSVYFDTVVVGDTVQQFVTLLNTNPFEITLDSLVVSGTPYFDAERIGQQVVPSGDSTVISVRCFPARTRRQFAYLNMFVHGSSSPMPLLLAVFARTPDAAQDIDPVVRTATLHPAYPNPFNPETRIEFDLARTAPAILQVFDISGRVVATLFDDVASAGHHALPFNGSALPSGVYFCRLQSGELSATQKMLLLK
jgi:hypothetical protein